MIGGTYWFVMLQTTLQFAFFMAQWEEYHTHSLPHCVGKWFGVSEVNYSLGILAIVNGFLDRVAFWQRPMKEVLAPLGDSVLKLLPGGVEEMELRFFSLGIWAIISVTLMALSIKRVMTHPNIANATAGGVTKRRIEAMLRLATPFALVVAAFVVPPSAVRTRYLSVTLGLTFSLLTKKMIVFSMAKMSFAAVQWDALPFLLAAMWIRHDEKLDKAGADFILGLLCFWYTFRLLRWANVTVNQICAKLDIYCFTLKKRKGD